MVDYTREIQAEQRVASQTPQVAPPSNSLGGDIVNAIGTGLQFYQQQQAKENVQQLTAQQNAYDSKLADAVMKLREDRLAWQAQELSPTEIARRENQRLKSYGDSQFAMAVVSSLKKATGTTGFTSLNKAQELERIREEEAKAELKAQREQEEQFNTLKNNAAKSASLAGLSTANIDNMSEEELQALEREGMIEEAQRQRTSLMIADEIQKDGYDAMKQEKKTQAYLRLAMPQFTNQFSSTINTLVDEAGGFRSVDKQALMDVIAQQKQQLPSLLLEQVQEAQRVGMPLNLEQQEAFKTQANDVINSWESILSEENLTNALSNMPKNITLQRMVKSLSSPNAEVRGAAIHTLTMLGTGQKLSNLETSEIITHLADLRVGQFTLPPPSEDPDGGATKSRVNALTKATSSPNAKGEFDETIHEQNRQYVETMLDGGPSVAKRVRKAGGLSGFVSGIVKAEGKNIAIEDREYTSQVIYEQASANISASIQAALNTDTVTLVPEGREMRWANTDTLNAYSLNEETLQLVPVNPESMTKEKSRGLSNYNRYIGDTLKALEFLGGDVKKFKEDVSRSVLVSSVR